MRPYCTPPLELSLGFSVHYKTSIHEIDAYRIDLCIHDAVHICSQYQFYT
jgi:hypothetical protein